MSKTQTKPATEISTMAYKEWQLPHDFVTEAGERIPRPVVAYHTAGRLNKARDNVIWVAHALTANSDVASWWPKMVGPGLLMDTNKYFVISANILGSCYGTTGPLSVNPETGKPYFQSFPFVTIRDMVRLHQELRLQLGIKSIEMLIGGSIGGYQALEWAVMEPQLPRHVVLLATSARSSPWSIAFNESQRMALQADPTFKEQKTGAGQAGLRAARSIALLSYRNSTTYNKTQQEPSRDNLQNFRASSYQQYQGDKLVKRFNALSYHVLLNAMDSHNIARHRKSRSQVLAQVKARTLVIGIQSDYLFPVAEQETLAKGISNAHLCVIDSHYGHDGFLIETATITNEVRAILSGTR